MFCTWVFSWAAVPTVCFINGHIFELPSDRLERLTSYVSTMSVAFSLGKSILQYLLVDQLLSVPSIIFTAYIFVLLWIDMNLLEVNSSIFKQSDSANVPMSNSEHTDDIIEPGSILINKALFRLIY